VSGYQLFSELLVWYGSYDLDAAPIGEDSDWCAFIIRSIGACQDRQNHEGGGDKRRDTALVVKNAERVQGTT
jgi:hypothetical protein